MAQFNISSTGLTSNPITFADLDDFELTPPFANVDLFAAFGREKVERSARVTAAIVAGGNTAAGGDGIAITSAAGTVTNPIALPSGTDISALGGGADSERFGLSALAAGAKGVAVGKGANAGGAESVAVGRSASSGGTSDLSLGYALRSIQFGPMHMPGSSISTGTGAVA